MWYRCGMATYTKLTDLKGQPLALTLFKKDTCPYCMRVLQALEELGITLPLRDTAQDPQAREELVRVGGKATVPCLFIDKKPLYESADIIAYLTDKVRVSK
jgi:glutaredoxin 3